jgi:menaquinone-dependent protoporphyrinogen IX oxidase
MNKALIVYASKTGTTKDVAMMIAKRLTIPSELYDCRSKELLDCSGEQKSSRAIPKVGQYCMVIMGTAMYMGTPMKEFKKFLATHIKELTQRPAAFFTCGVGTWEEDEAYLRKSLPEPLKSRQLIYRHMGGEVRLDRMSGFARFAMKEYEKQHGKSTGIDWRAVDEMVMDMTAQFGGMVS